MNRPLIIKNIRRVNNRNYQVYVSLKDETQMFDRVFEMNVPLYYDEDKHSAVTLYSSENSIDILELDKTLFKVMLHKDLKEVLLGFEFHNNVSDQDVWEYLHRLILANVTQNPTINKLTNYKLRLDDEIINVQDIDEHFYISFVDNNGNYGVITKNNIKDNTLQLDDDATSIQIFPQYVYSVLGRKVYITEHEEFDTSQDAINIDLCFFNSINISLAFTAINYNVEEDEKELVKSLVRKYGEYDIFNAETGLVYAKNISINHSPTVIQVDKLPVDIRVRPYTKDEYGHKLCLMSIVSSTEQNPEHINGLNGSLGTLTVYKKFHKSMLNLKFHNIGSGYSTPVGTIKLKLRNVNNDIIKATNSTPLRVGVYKLERIYLQYGSDKVYLRNIQAEYQCQGKLNYMSEKLIKKEDNEYIPTSPLNIVVNSRETLVHLHGESKLKLIPCHPRDLKLWGWLLNLETSKFLKRSNDGAYDLDLDHKLTKTDISLREAVRQGYINALILEYVNGYSDCTISLGNEKYENVFDMNDNKTISLYTNFIKARQDLNNLSAVLGLNIGNSLNFKNMPGWLTFEEANILKQDHKEVKKFVEEFCDLHNVRFLALAKTIVSLLFMSNYVNIEINESMIDYPGYIILFARAIKVINDVLLSNGIENLAGYSISLPIIYGPTEKTLPNSDKGGVDIKFRDSFIKNKLKLLMQDQDFVQLPLYISTYFRSLLDSPPTDNYEKYLIESSTHSQELLQGLLNTSTTQETNARVMSSVLGFVYEPVGSRDHKIDAESLSKMVKSANSNGILGLVNRMHEQGYNAKYRTVKEENKIKSSKVYEPFNDFPNNNYELISKFGYKLIDLETINNLFRGYKDLESDN